MTTKIKIIHFLKELRRRHETTVIFTTHDMEDVKSLCERLIIVNKGKLIVDDKINNLEKYTKLYTLTTKIKILIVFTNEASI